MGRGKKYEPEQVVNLLWQIEVAIANGKTTALACKEAGIVEQTYFRWRKEYGGLQVDQAKRLKELEQENSKLKLGSEPESGQPCVEGLRLGKLLSPERRRIATDHAQQQQHGMTERRACRLANQPRGTQRYRAIRREDEDALTQAIIQLASQYGRYGYRRITALLKRAGWRVGKDRVERISTPRTKTCPRGPRYPASRGAEGAAEAEATRTTVAQRRLVCTVETGAAEPCVELRLRQHTDP